MISCTLNTSAGSLSHKKDLCCSSRQTAAMSDSLTAPRKGTLLARGHRPTTARASAASKNTPHCAHGPPLYLRRNYAIKGRKIGAICSCQTGGHKRCTVTGRGSVEVVLFRGEVTSSTSCGAQPAIVLAPLPAGACKGGVEK